MDDYQQSGFATFNVPASKGGRGRPSGGLSTWVVTHLGVMAKQVSTNSPDILCVLLTSRVNKPLAIINIYSRPTQGGQESLVIEQLRGFIKSLDPEAGIIIGGDFNCQFEPLNNLSTEDPDEENLYWNIPEPAITTVKAWTPLVLQILSLSLSLSVRPCNGRLKSDRPGNVTFNRVGQSSIIDYIMIECRSWDKVQDFKIYYQTDSDRNALVMSLKPGNWGMRYSAPETNPPPYPLLLHNNRRRVKWPHIAGSPTRQSEIFCQILPYLSKMADVGLDGAVVERDSRPVEIHQQLTSILLEVFFPPQVFKENLPKNLPKTHPWYTAECRKIKGELVKAVKVSDRPEIKLLRVLYKHVLERERKTWEEGHWEDLREALQQWFPNF